MNVTYLALELELTFNVVLAIFNNLSSSQRFERSWERKLKPLLDSCGFRRMHHSIFFDFHRRRYLEPGGKEINVECNEIVWEIQFNPLITTWDEQNGIGGKEAWKFPDNVQFGNRNWVVFKFYRNLDDGDEFFAKIKEIFRFNFPNLTLH